MRKMLLSRKTEPSSLLIDFGAGAVVADRLLDDDPRTGRHQPLFAEALRHRAEEIGTGREIEGANALVRSQKRAKLRPAFLAHHIDGSVVDAGEEALHRGVVLVGARAKFEQRVLHRQPECVAVVVAPGDADDAGRFGELLASLPVQERWIELAVGKVARAAEDDEIERFNFHNACGHWRLLRVSSTGCVGSNERGRTRFNSPGPSRPLAEPRGRGRNS